MIKANTDYSVTGTQKRIRFHLQFSMHARIIHNYFKTGSLGEKYVKAAKLEAIITNNSIAASICDLLLSLSKRQRKQIKWN